MQTSRRIFVGATLCGLTGASLAATGAALASGDDGKTSYKLHPIGKVENKPPAVAVRVLDEYKDALLGLDQWSHLLVFYWLDQNDTPEKRRILRVRPQGNPANPLTGVFACRAPFRPNLIALSVCKILGVEGNVVKLDAIDAFDGTPVLDLKPFTPADAPAPESVRVPAWAKRR